MICLRSIAMFSGILLCAGVLVDPATAQTASLNPTADSFVESGSNASNNYGKAGALAVAGPSTIKASDSLLRFNTAAAISGFNSTFGTGKWTIQSAQLTLTSAAPNNAAVFNNPSVAGNFAVSLMTDDTWTEGTGTPGAPGSTGVTFNNQPALSGDLSIGTFAYNGGTSGATTFTLPLTSSFLTSLNSGGDVDLRLTAVDSTMSWVFNSKDFSNSADFPVLFLTAVPEPASALMLLPVAATLLRRRKGQR